MISFKDWVRSNTFIVGDEMEDCLNKIVADESFPQSVRMWVMLDYMKDHYSKDEIKLFKSLYKEDYIHYITQTHEPS